MDLNRLYDILYEDSIPIIQWFLKTFPIEALPIAGNKENKTSLGGVEIPNPVILSSHYYDTRILAKAMRLGFGAVTTKTITMRQRDGYPRPTVVRKNGNIINCEGFRNPGMEKYKKMLEGLEKTKPLIISISGDSSEEFAALTKNLSSYADILELNISCPNVESVYKFINDPDRLRRTFYACRESTEKPISVKLSPDFEEANYDFAIPIAIENGVEIINFGNTKRVFEPRLSQRAGGLSGPGLYENMLLNVERICKDFDDIDIIATGGIDNPEKAYNAMQKGAKAISLLTAFTRNPYIAREINSYLAPR